MTGLLLTILRDPKTWFALALVAGGVWLGHTISALDAEKARREAAEADAVVSAAEATRMREAVSLAAVALSDAEARAAQAAERSRQLVQAEDKLRGNLEALRRAYDDVSEATPCDLPDADARRLLDFLAAPGDNPAGMPGTANATPARP